MRKARVRLSPARGTPAEWVLSNRPPATAGGLVAALPWPPSVNSYWRSPPRLGRTILSERGRAYREAAVQLLMVQRLHGRLTPGRLSIVLSAFPPDERTRDLDNLLKPVLDVLTHAGTIEDDGQFDRLTIERGPKLAPWGLVTLMIRQLEVRND